METASGREGAARVPNGDSGVASPTSCPPEVDEALLCQISNLAEAVREPLIICVDRKPSVHAPGRVLVANPMACALLNRTLEAVQSLPLSSLVAAASGRPPPPGLVSKCRIFCADSTSVSVECDCRVLDWMDTTPLLFYHLALVDWKGFVEGGSILKRLRRRKAAAEPADEGSSGFTGNSSDEDLGGEMERSFRSKALADVNLERLNILLVEDDLFSVEAVRAPSHAHMCPGMRMRARVAARAPSHACLGMRTCARGGMRA